MTEHRAAADVADTFQIYRALVELWFRLHPQRLEPAILNGLLSVDGTLLTDLGGSLPGKSDLLASFRARLKRYDLEEKGLEVPAAASFSFNPENQSTIASRRGGLVEAIGVGDAEEIVASSDASMAAEDATSGATGVSYWSRPLTARPDAGDVSPSPRAMPAADAVDDLHVEALLEWWSGATSGPRPSRRKSGDAATALQDSDREGPGLVSVSDLETLPPPLRMELLKKRVLSDLQAAAKAVESEIPSIRAAALKLTKKELAGLAEAGATTIEDLVWNLPREHVCYSPLARAGAAWIFRGVVEEQRKWEGRGMTGLTYVRWIALPTSLLINQLLRMAYIYVSLFLHLWLNSICLLENHMWHVIHLGILILLLPKQITLNESVQDHDSRPSARSPRDGNHHGS